MATARERARSIVNDVLRNRDEEGYTFRIQSSFEKESFRVALNTVRREYTEVEMAHVSIETGRSSDINYSYYVRVRYINKAGQMLIVKNNPDGSVTEIDPVMFTKGKTKIKTDIKEIEKESDDDYAKRMSDGKENAVQRAIRQMSEDKMSFEQMKRNIGDDFDTPEAQEYIKMFYSKEVTKLSKKVINFSDWPPTAVDIIAKLINDGKTKEEIQETNPPFRAGQKHEELIDLMFEDGFDINAAKTYVKDSAQY